MEKRLCELCHTSAICKPLVFMDRTYDTCNVCHVSMINSLKDCHGACENCDKILVDSRGKIAITSCKCNVMKCRGKCATCSRKYSHCDTCKFEYRGNCRRCNALSIDERIYIKRRIPHDKRITNKRNIFMDTILRFHD